ncbi:MULTISPECIES: hydrogen peroxide-inducible genes activator [Rufibacter]|uniref:LysR family hydrogen peroxide-inducible transcriptional activator n=1 Tax=Rufibacter quisquiliarum TaxID=1549639 RepID=A0A839GM68_9BACT|nr:MULTISPECIES: hydrogen peroxide-inducible genes activator [Rufibacter]MBA9076665.1 LysR family hydrogen peroxide-inducible transcriptional activator [Rufibacter quisquiliarum]
MTLTQLEYLLAVDTYRHFATAAEKCFVTQPTLSMQLQKLEDELGVQVFDRSRVPVRPTELGKDVIAQARIAVAEFKKIEELVQVQRDGIAGELRLGVIPTLAPYLVPLFITDFIQKYPKVHVSIQEMVTTSIVEKLKLELLDVGLLVTPLHDKTILEIPLFYEAFVGYLHPDHPLSRQEKITSESIDPSDLWLLNDGHCFRSQVLQLCNRAKNTRNVHLDYESGSLETLKRIVETQSGMTLLPELSVQELPQDRKAMVRPFAEPQPLREVSLVVHRSFLKKKMIESLRDEIVAHVPKDLLERHPVRVVKIK